MSLPKYKQWKIINEAFGNEITLGVAVPQSLGVIGSKFDPNDWDAMEEAAKKKMLDIQVSEKPDEDKLEDKPEKKEKEELSDEKHEKKGKKDKKPPFFKKKDDEGGEEKEEKKDDEGGEEKPFFGKKKKMTAEETEWWNSLQSMTNYNPNHKFSSGLNLEEEKLLAPSDPNAGLISDANPEPQEGNPEPGEVGFAPSTRIGWFN
jgi:hypothetical protein